MSEKFVQTAGREQLGEFTPDFAHFNDDIFYHACGRRGLSENPVSMDIGRLT